MNHNKINELKNLIPKTIWNEAIANSAENGFESDYEALKESIRLLAQEFEEFTFAAIANHLTEE